MSISGKRRIRALPSQPGDQLRDVLSAEVGRSVHARCNPATVAGFLKKRTDAVVRRAAEGVGRRRLRHYVGENGGECASRMRSLLAAVVETLQTGNVGPVIKHSENAGRERFSSRYDLVEVQTAYKALEESVWSLLREEYSVEDFAAAIGYVSTVFGFGRDALARAYVHQVCDMSRRSPAPHTHR